MTPQSPAPVAAKTFSVGDYAVRLEDHPLVKAGEVHQVVEMFRGGYLGFAKPIGGEWNPKGWRKCDAEGWMPWSGGENPVPGQRVDYRMSNGHVGNGWHADNLRWTNEVPEHRIIAFRLSRPASDQPVEAIGAGREEVAGVIQRLTTDLNTRNLYREDDGFFVLKVREDDLRAVLAALSPASPARTPMGVASREHLLALLEAAFVAGSCRQPNEHWAAEAEHYAKVTVDALSASPVAARPAAPTPIGESAGDPTAWPETLDWSTVDTEALCHLRASFGDYVLDVVQGHNQDWSYRVNHTGRMGFDRLESATAAAMEDLTGRLKRRWSEAKETMRLYAAPMGGRVDGHGGVTWPAASADLAREEGFESVDMLVDKARIGVNLMERLPEGYAYSDCPTEIVTDLQNKLDEAKTPMGGEVEALREASGCFEAAFFEGWIEALAEGDIERIRDLWERRISWAASTISEALAASSPSPAQGGIATWHPLDDNGMAEVRINGKRITTMPSYPGAEEVAQRINAALSASPQPEAGEEDPSHHQVWTQERGWEHPTPPSVQPVEGK